MSKEIKLEKSTMMVLEANKKGLITYINNDFTQITGYTTADLFKQSYKKLKFYNIPKKEYKEFLKKMKDKETWKGTVKNYTKDGNYYWTNVSSFPIEKENNKVKYIFIKTKASSKDIEKAKEKYKKYKDSM